ncbi:hypothetical protein GBZ26_04005 [Azospirillum formosense]|uniref:Uncharacterized protein n=1 Tax=Azospirillum formosense TaxID=861533 RepID=A0ABX2KXV3_9PROT|nr:hypothetical protein [Azospirillum formosense]MBY3755736.1 hypothetical protein [Azospirillum formosense]NUB18388.1 hypothetical protein [Azospirillum formosense]
MLERTEIRAATVALLKGATTAGDRVYATRLMPQVGETYPTILVYTYDEDMTRRGGTPPQFAHDLTMVIDVRMKASEDGDAEDALDALCKAILERLLTNAEWVAQFEEISSVKTRIIPNDEGRHPLVLALIGISGKFHTIWQPVVPDAFEATRVGVDCIDPADPNLTSPGPDGRLEAEGVFTIPT